MWTRFMDMHSGGGQKEDFAYLLIEAPEAEAKVIFYNRFHHNPDRVSCTCCGEDYSTDEHKTLADATAHDRGLPFVEDERGWQASKATDFREGFYLEPGEEVPVGMKLSRISSLFQRDPVTLDDFLVEPSRFGYKIITASEIEDAERAGEIPEQGYVWID